MHLAVTGAGGFIGRKVVEMALARQEISGVTVTDRLLPALPPDPRLRAIEGDIADPQVQDSAVDGADGIIHLAAVLGGSAEVDPVASRRINLDATLDLIDRATGRRFVLASTIAVYGTPPPLVDDDTPCAPRLVYAMHKRMAEIALETATRRDEIDGFALRIAGVVPRPRSATGLKSAFLSELFHAMRESRRITLPVAPKRRTWLTSVETVAKGLLHTVLLPCGIQRSHACFALPALTPRFEELVAALSELHRLSPTPAYEPDPQIMASFGAFGDLIPAEADRLGFPADDSLRRLVESA